MAMRYTASVAKILIVDDSRVGRLLVRRGLPANWAVEISEVSDGQEAIKALTACDFEVVFLDLTMPNLDGYGVLRWLKSWRHQPIVIVISADLQPEAKVRTMLLGAFDFINKPPRPEQVYDILELAGVLQ